jgi:hypothetical protein
MVKLVRGCAVELRGHLPTPRIPLCSLADDPQSAQLIVHRRMQGTMHESVFVSLQVAEALRVPSYSQVRRFYTKGPKYSKSKPKTPIYTLKRRVGNLLTVNLAGWIAAALKVQMSSDVSQYRRLTLSAS